MPSKAWRSRSLLNHLWNVALRRTVYMTRLYAMAYNMGRGWGAALPLLLGELKCAAVRAFAKRMVGERGDSEDSLR